MMFKYLIDKLVLNEKWTSLSKYMIPKKIIFTDDIEAKHGGYCEYTFFSCEIRIRPKYINDTGLIEHEKTHARQYGRLFWIHSALSMMSGKYRLLVELEAYRSQVKEYNYTHELDFLWIVDSLDKKYNTCVSRKKITEYARYTFKDLL